VYDIPSATETVMQGEFVTTNSSAPDCLNGTAVVAPDDPALDSFNANFNLLYSLYAWPNILLPFFGGLISDILGVRLMGVVFMVRRRRWVGGGGRSSSTSPTMLWALMHPTPLIPVPAMQSLIAIGQLIVALGSSYIKTAPQAAWWTM
jgi:hypothetical protein